MKVNTLKTGRRANYVLDDQIGFVLRLVNQRHTTLFAQRIGCRLTTTQWAALSKLYEVGPKSQNELGRLTAMDVATIKGVVDRLAARGLCEFGPDPGDRRRRFIALTPKGKAMVETHAVAALEISDETLAPLSARDRQTLRRLLDKLL